MTNWNKSPCCTVLCGCYHPGVDCFLITASPEVLYTYMHKIMVWWCWWFEGPSGHRFTQVYVRGLEQRGDRWEVVQMFQLSAFLFPATAATLKISILTPCLRALILLFCSGIIKWTEKHMNYYSNSNNDHYTARTKLVQIHNLVPMSWHV